MSFPSISRVTLASTLGYTSIACWLCAQLPQVIKNAKLRSCEGLALPFLMNWLFGDITNLIGCLLTDQLPFQTYLAAYFVCIDFALCAQYFHYRSTNKSTQSHSHSHHTATALSPSQQPYSPIISYYPSVHQSLVLPPATSQPHSPRVRSTSHPPPQPSQPTNHPRPRYRRPNPSSAHIPNTSNPELIITNPSPLDASYAAIYEAALDVARAAERVSARRSESVQKQRERKGKRERERLAGVQRDLSEGEEGLMESFHSDMSGRSGSTVGPIESPGVGNDGGRRRFSGTGGGGSAVGLVDGRGRTLRRSRIEMIPTVTDEEGEEIEGLPGEGGREMRELEGERSKSRSVSLVRGHSGRGGGRRAAGMAFMALGVVGTWSRLGTGGFSGNQLERYHGVVLSSRSERVESWPIRHPLTPISPSTQALVMVPPRNTYDTLLFLEHDHESDHTRPGHLPDGPPDIQRIVGRISAWSCTTLYLTSRLPQIWKNFTRKSVEGLSILLFVFAFCGNLSYVFSILLNPAGNADPSEATHYLLESLPYLLGSGGTLLFDLTIMVQSAIYGSAPPVPATPSHRSHTILGRKRYRHLEDGRGVTVSVSSERQPLLSGLPTPVVGERSLSPAGRDRARTHEGGS